MPLSSWSLRHRRAVVAAWLVVLVAALGLARGIGNHFVNDITLPHTESQRAADLLRSGFPALAGDVDHVVFHARSGTLRPDALAPTLRRVARLPHVVGVSAPRLSRDGTVAFSTVSFDERGDALPVDAVKRVVHVARAGTSPRLEIELGGNAIEQVQRPSLGAATAVGVAAAVVVLLLSFGSIAAMSLPIVAALFGLGAAGGLIAAASHALDTPDFASQLAIMIGLGVGVDYALFVVTRFRDAYRTNGGDAVAAVDVAMRTAGRSIVFAGVTVVIALLGLFAVGVHAFYGVALASSVSVAAVLVSSQTLLPVLLVSLGDRVGRVRPRRATRVALWSRWIAVVQRRPAVAALAATAVLLALAAPALDLRLAWSDAGNDGASTTTRRAYDLLAGGFGPGVNASLRVVTRDRAALPRLAAALRATTDVAAVSAPRIGPRGDTAVIDVVPASTPQARATYDLVKRLRARAHAADATALVGGFTASQVDFAHALATKLPLFVGIVVGLSALLLLLVFRSLLIPVQAAAMNLLALGASLGVVQAVFERGWLAGVVGAGRAPIEPFIPVIAFAIVFGLSMDYEVFLVSRIHEEWRRSGDASAAVREGLARTGRVITAAAAVMIVVFASFAASSEHVVKLFGLTLATAVFLDAIVIRTILLPAVLELSRRATWTLPRPLERVLPRLAPEPVEPAPTAALPEAA